MIDVGTVVVAPAGRGRHRVGIVALVLADGLVIVDHDDDRLSSTPHRPDELRPLIQPTPEHHTPQRAVEMRPPHPEYPKPVCAAICAHPTSENEEPCAVCDHIREYGRRGPGEPVHCRTCHHTWSGNEAQHCVTCHHTFTSIHAADRHRWKRPNGTCTDPCTSTDPNWHERRPGVWSYGHRPADANPVQVQRPTIGP